MRRLDPITLKEIELKAPGACEEDAEALYGRVISGKIFSNFNAQEREILWRELCSTTTECLVPSLFGFFENLTLYREFLDPSESNRGCLIQVSRSRFKYMPCTSADRFRLLYKQLWLFAVREYLDMPAKSKKKLAIAGEFHANETILFEFASLAEKLGHGSEKITEILQSDPDRDIAIRFLHTARKSDRYIWRDFDYRVSQVVNAFSAAEPRPDGDQTEDSEVDEVVKSPSRSGTPHDADQRRDKSLLFLANLYQRVERHCRSLTSFFIQRSIFFEFFGKETGIAFEELADADDANSGMSFWGQSRGQGSPSGNIDSGHRILEMQCSKLQETIERLEDALRTKEGILQQYTAREQDARGRVEQLERERTEHEARLQILNTEEQRCQAAIDQLTANQRRLREEIDRQANILRAEEAHRSQLDELEAKERSQQGVLQSLATAEQGKTEDLRQLESIEHQKQSYLEQLDAEITRKTNALQDIAINTENLRAEEVEVQSRIRLATEEEERLRAVIEEEVNKQFEFRGQLELPTAHVEQHQPEQQMAEPVLQKEQGILEGTTEV